MGGLDGRMDGSGGLDGSGWMVGLGWMDGSGWMDASGSAAGLWFWLNIAAQG
jgi:hypothetical protein